MRYGANPLNLSYTAVTGSYNTNIERNLLLRPRIPEDLPEPSDYAIKQIGPEFALIGKSNAGKSSMINLITGNASLAKVSKKPGHTKTINHFLINRKWMLVDCPGYGDQPGYQVSKQERQAWHELTKEYFIQRRSLAHIFLIIDASSKLGSDDVNASTWIHDLGRPWSIIFSKLDVIQAGLPNPIDNMESTIDTLEALTGAIIPSLPTSAATGFGKEGVLKYISSLRQNFKTPLIFK
ncbi:hypothetical protein CEUSTIGMA_g2810.t1 [Chlamydomonas eustigma]|uniref:EngB-type G domain-containing protein n=1 Tax=Chlamydomonas eustigma TaxID=1157962 RepID=A0A250WX59_9CHLO|nr:hypothetical protein CEUSTIGMA_g2810.t1 [Chlamydomonas eustigma]|eukprot:GAX75366.1 hypothetical protein CEUSTIGMA_g2810.t1 [Chlamydomonas eustigma]